MILGVLGLEIIISRCILHTDHIYVDESLVNILTGVVTSVDPHRCHMIPTRSEPDHLTSSGCHAILPHLDVPPCCYEVLFGLSGSRARIL